MHLVFDIFQGIGIAAAVGIRPFLPALVTGALAAGNVGIHFNGTDYDFLQQGLVPACAGRARDRAGGDRAAGRRQDQLERGPVALGIALCALALGALFFAGSLARGHYSRGPD